MDPANQNCILFPERLQDAEGPKIFQTFGFAALYSGVLLLFTSLGAVLPSSRQENVRSDFIFGVSSGIVAGALLI